MLYTWLLLVLLLVFIEDLLKLLKYFFLWYHLAGSDTVVSWISMLLLLLHDGRRILCWARVRLWILGCCHHRRLMRPTHELALTLWVIILLWLFRWSIVLFLRCRALPLHRGACFRILTVRCVARLTLNDERAVLSHATVVSDKAWLFLQDETAVLVHARTHLILLKCWWDQTFASTCCLLVVISGGLTCFWSLLRDWVWRPLLRVKIWLAWRALLCLVSVVGLLSNCHITAWIMMLSIWIAHRILLLILVGDRRILGLQVLLFNSSMHQVVRVVVETELLLLLRLSLQDRGALTLIIVIHRLCLSSRHWAHLWLRGSLSWTNVHLL